jgi:hypothetical protein
MSRVETWHARYADDHLPTPGVQPANQTGDMTIVIPNP